MKQYLNLLQELVDKYKTGQFKEDRTGTGTVSVFGRQLKYDLTNEKIPLLTTKKLHVQSIVLELIWILQGRTNNNWLTERGCTIWNEWASESGELGPIYGEQLRDFNGVDQLQNVIGQIRNNPTSRRHIISYWNPAVLPIENLSSQNNVKLGKQALAPCHAFFQFNCEKIPLEERYRMANKIPNLLWDISVLETRTGREEGKKLLDAVIPEYYLDCQLYQRSGDIFLGIPYNIAFYSIFTHIIGRLTNTYPREFIHTIGDAHLYLNHIEQAELQLKRKPLDSVSTIEIEDFGGNIDKLDYDNIIIHGYEAHPNIKAPVAV